jgi:hypothetical protein
MSVVPSLSGSAGEPVQAGCTTPTVLSEGIAMPAVFREGARVSGIEVVKSRIVVKVGLSRSVAGKRSSRTRAKRTIGSERRLRVIQL